MYRAFIEILKRHEIQSNKLFRFLPYREEKVSSALNMSALKTNQNLNFAIKSFSWILIHLDLLHFLLNPNYTLNSKRINTLRVDCLSLIIKYASYSILGLELSILLNCLWIILCAPYYDEIFHWNLVGRVLCLFFIVFCWCFCFKKNNGLSWWCQVIRKYAVWLNFSSYRFLCHIYLFFLRRQNVGYKSKTFILRNHCFN